jgi:hypothetical protein
MGVSGYQDLIYTVLLYHHLPSRRFYGVANNADKRTFHFEKAKDTESPGSTSQVLVTPQIAHATLKKKRESGHLGDVVVGVTPDMACSIYQTE